MAVLEYGVMYSGIPIIKVNYYEENPTDIILTAGLLEAIQAFAIEIFNDETESFKMKKYSIFLHKTELKSKQTVTFYSICDSSDRPMIIKQIMHSLAQDFYSDFNNVDPSCLTNYEPFKTKITKRLGDLIYRPEDRLRRVFIE